jgi:hypothetical protein
VYFDPQDYVAYVEENSLRKRLPRASGKTTFEPLLKQYIGMAKLFITVAAASISFGGLQLSNVGIYTAKLFLAFSIGFGLLFCILAVFFYESYLHDLEFYKPVKCALVESLGASSLVCFFLGYGWWAYHLKP